MMSGVVVAEVHIGTDMFLIAPRVQELASWDGADGETKAGEATQSGYFERNVIAEGRAA